MFPLLGILGGIGSALIGASATNSAATAQANATRYAADTERQNQQDQLALLQPSIAAGDTARDYQLGALGLPGGVDASTATAAFRNSPGYQFGLKQGTNAVQTSAAAGGDLFSGKTLKSLDNYASGQADQNFNQWLGDLGGISGQGQGSTGAAVNLGTATAGNLSDLAVQGGQNQASSYINNANNVTNTLGGLADLYYKYGKGYPTAPAATGAPMALQGSWL